MTASAVLRKSTVFSATESVRVRPAIDRLRSLSPRLHLPGDIRALAKLLDMKIQLIPQRPQSVDERLKLHRIIKILADLVRRKTKILKNPDSSDARKRVDGVIAVAVALSFTSGRTNPRSS